MGVPIYSYDEVNFKKFTAFKKLSRTKKIEGDYFEFRIKPNSIPKDKYMYHIRHASSGKKQYYSIEPNVMVNFYGTLITDTPIDFPNSIGDRYLEITRIQIEEKEDK